MNGLVKQSYRVGEWLLKLLKLQVYWLLYTLKGGIILGFFPATGTVFRIVYQWLAEPKNEVSIPLEFASYSRENGKELNKIGYLLGTILIILAIDLRVSQLFIQSYVLHYFLVALLVLVLGTSLYVFPIFSRYDLSTLNYLKQGFYFFFTNILETVAMLIGSFLVVLVLTVLPILVFVGGVPLFAIPSSWFAYQAMKKMELRKTESSLES